MFLKYEEIVKFLKEKGLYSEQVRVVYATQRIGGSINAYFLLVFDNDKVSVLNITAMGKLDQVLDTFSANQVEVCSIKKKFLFGYKCHLKSGQDEGDFHINKSMVGAKWHKEQFESLISQPPAYLTIL